MIEWFEPLSDYSGGEAAVLIVQLLGGLSILVFTLVTGVPPMPSNPRIVAVMFALIPPDRDYGTIYDLGCGWGRLVFALAARFPDAHVIGIELSPLPWAFCKLRQLVQRRGNLEIRYGNFLKAPLGDSDLIVCYLMIRPMTQLAVKLAAELRPGTVVISNSFALRDWEADAVEVVPEAMSAWVYRYRVGPAHQVSSRKP